MSARLPLLAAALVAALALPAAAQAKHASPSKAAPQYYVSLGDSYASGWNPVLKHNTKDGFVYQVPALAKKKGYDLQIVNFGCGGATTGSVLNQLGCAKLALGPGAASYNGVTQAAAATKFIKAHRKQVALITVSISGNDVTKCATATDVLGCVNDALTGINTNLKTLVKQLRSAAGPKVKIIGTTYPDVILGAWVHPGGAAAQGLATASTTVFKNLINPALKKQYESVGGQFVDVTAATGAYGPLTTMVTDPTFGSIPAPVEQVCTLTYYCSIGDIHSKRAGYGVISKLVVGDLPKVKKG